MNRKTNNFFLLLGIAFSILVFSSFAHAEGTNGGNGGFFWVNDQTPAPVVSSASGIPLTSPDSIEEIANIARGNEGCMNSFVRGRGSINQFSGSYVGLAISMARSICRSDNDPARRDVITGISSNMDSLRYAGLERGSERDTYINTYTMLLGHMARESTGRFWSGVDRTANASMNNAEQAEAGLCQASNNINMYFPSGREGRERIMEQYNSNPEACLLETFSQGHVNRIPDLNSLVYVTRRGIREISPLGQPIDPRDEDSDGSVAFQRLMRTCPAAAAEFCAISIRHVRRHFGPITRREVPMIASCKQTFTQVYDLVSSNRERLCN